MKFSARVRAAMTALDNLGVPEKEELIALLNQVDRMTHPDTAKELQSMAEHYEEGTYDPRSHMPPTYWDGLE